jgi:hypothetical protein
VILSPREYFGKISKKNIIERALIFLTIRVFHSVPGVPLEKWNT